LGGGVIRHILRMNYGAFLMPTLVPSMSFMAAGFFFDLQT
jgi:hypothetical protein